MRDVLSFSYTHEWYTEIARDLSEEAVEEAVAWRQAWLEQRTADGRSDAPGRLSARTLRAIHNGMRARRDHEESQARMRLGAVVAMAVGYGGWAVVSRRWQRGDRQ